ncbi:cAMP-dependent protein kinase catalytic subunit [Marasmius tenuissimus]|nr:cAMP-dependent protein kinase catalytic subunit [Marasmius tenuissimus]
MEGDPSRRYGNLRHGAGDAFAHGWFTEVDWGKLAVREITAPYLPKINGFDKYSKDNAAAAYGSVTPDPFRRSFPGFEYSSYS